MSLSIEPVALGRTALDSLAASIRNAQAGGPLTPVTVIVSTNTAGVIARRYLARSGGIAAVQFLTVYRLAELLAGHRLASGGRRPLTTPVLNATIRSVLRDEPGRFAAVSGHETTVDGLRSTYRELRELPGGFVDLLARDGSPMSAETVRVFHGVRARLSAGWYDETDLMVEGAAAAAEGPPNRLGRVIVHLPERLSPAAQDLLVAIGRWTDVRIAAGTAGDERADRSIRRLVAAFADRVEIDPDSICWPEPPAIDAEIEITDVSDADDEVRVAVRRVLRAAHDGVPCEQIAVLWSTAEPYARALTGALAAAGLPWNGPSPVRLSEQLGGRALLGLLDLDRFGLRRRDVFAWLATTPVRDDLRRPVPVATWERISRESGVARGDWAGRLERHRQKCLERANALRQSGHEHSAMRAEQDADHSADLSRFIGWLVDELGDPRSVRSWESWGAWSHRVLARLLGGEAARRSLPEDQQSAIEQVEAAIDRLRGLDEVADRATRRGYAVALEAELDAVLGRVGRIGDGVLLGPLSTANGLAAELTIVLGAVDGKLPAPPVSNPLIGDDDRAIVPLLRDGVDHVLDQRRHLILALRSAPQVMIGVARGDLRRSARHHASRWIDELVPESCRRVDHHRSFTHGIDELRFPATATEHRLRSLRSHVCVGGRIDDHPLAVSDTMLRRNLRLLRARESAEFTEFDGDLSAVSLPSPIGGGRVLSPTQLERWAACPHRYFVERILDVAVVEDHDEDLRLTAIDRGSLLHTVFDEFLQLVLNGELEMPGPDEPWSSAHRGAAFERLAATSAAYEADGLTGRELLWSFDRNRLRSELRRWLNRDDGERGRRHTNPAGSEQRFGFDDSNWRAAEVTLPDGRIVRFRGSIDRLDRSSDGRWFVTDHKTGSGSRYKRIKDANPVDGGRCLQLGVYAAAVATQMSISPIGITSEYSFTGRTQGNPRNGYAITAEIWETFLDAVATIVDGISSGLFPPRPPRPSTFQLWIECPICDPDGMGTTESFRAATRKQNDPRLARMIALSGEDA